MNNITLNADSYVTSNLVLDLNGYTLDLSNTTLSPYEATLTIKDYSEAQTGIITSTDQHTIIVGDSTHGGSLVLDGGTIDCEGAYGIRNYGSITINGGTISSDEFTIYNEGTSLTINDGHLISTNGTVITNKREGTSFIMNGGLVQSFSDEVAVYLSAPNASFTMNGGTIEATYNTPGLSYGAAAIVAYKETTVTINDGSITAFDFAIAGNGSRSGNNEGTNAKFNINGGTITSLASTAVYAPQISGVTTITGGTISGRTGIEIRAGTLNVSGGSISGHGEYEVHANSSGTTTLGAAVAIAQHTTVQPITVSITGGDFTAEVPLSNANPQGYDQLIFDQVDINVLGGKFTGNNLDDVSDNIPSGYAGIEEESASTITIVVVQKNPAGYYLTADTSGSIDINGPSGTATTDYSEIDVMTNCQAGYSLIMGSSVNDNTLYLNSDDTSDYYFASINDNTQLISALNTWGYAFSSDPSYTPTSSDYFHATPTLSDPVTIRSTSETAKDSDINDKMRLYFGANIGSSLTEGKYQLPYDESNAPGSIIYQITASPTCTDMPVEISYNQNIDGEGGSETDASVDNFPTYMDNTIHIGSGDPTTITLSDKVPTRDDYVFIEWNRRPDGTGVSYHPGDVITVGNDSGAGELIGDVILYAIWEDGCAGATICYDGNGADDGIMEDQHGERGSNVVLNTSNFSRAGYGFVGWNTQADGSGTSYSPQQTIPVPSSGGIILYASWIASVGTLQTWTGANDMEIGDVTALTDERDNQTYAVAKLDDGNIWLIENLRLDPSSVNFNIVNTNNPTSSFMIDASHSSSSNDFCKRNDSSCIDTLTYNTNNLDRSLTQSPTNNDNSSAWYGYGVYYNWHTATAGNGTYSYDSTSGAQGDGTVSGDICPAGWHLPTGNSGEFVTLNDSIVGSSSSDVKLRTLPNNFVRSGEFSGTTSSDRGAIGRYWSSTASEKNKAYRFGYNESSITPNNTWNKYNGFSVRCIYDGDRISASVVTVNLAEHVNSVTFTNSTYGNYTVTVSGSTVTLANNVSYEIGADIDEGYTINAWTSTENGQVDNASSINTSYEITGSASLSLTTKVATLTTYTLNYDTSPSAETISSISATSYHSSHIFEISNTHPYLFGQTLIGWSETQGAVVADYVPGGNVTLTNADPDNVSTVSKTLYAVYQTDSCPVNTICYFGNSADTGTMSNQSASSNTNVTLIAPNYAKSGYGFAGWITSENATPYGPNATITTPDLSTSGLKLYAKWVASTGDLQGWNSCSTMNLGDITALTDSRDDNTYLVAKLDDNNCWMVENLRLNPSTANITSQNTNTPASSFATEASSSSPSNNLCSSDNAECDNKLQYNVNNLNRSLTQSHDGTGASVAWYGYGAYYNWYTATAGNGTYNYDSTSGAQGDGTVSGDICPAGWHLPTGGSGGEYKALNIAINNGSTSNTAAWRNYPNNFVYSGEYKSSSRSGATSQTRLWTATASTNAQAYRMGLDIKSTFVTPEKAFNKWDALVVRCVYTNQ